MDGDLPRRTVQPGERLLLGKLCTTSMSKIVAKPTGKLCTIIPSSVAFEGISNKKNGSTRDDVPARNILEIGGITGGEGVGLEARGVAAAGEVLRYLKI